MEHLSYAFLPFFMHYFIFLQTLLIIFSFILDHQLSPGDASTVRDLHQGDVSPFDFVRQKMTR